MGKLIFIDMDDTIADFMGSEAFRDGFVVEKMYEVGFFLNLKPIKNSLSSVRRLINAGHDVHILTQPVAESAISYIEKVQWISLYFPELVKKIHMTQDKGLFNGDYLIDDNPKKWKDKFEANGGQFITFNVNHSSHDWNAIMVQFFGE